MNHGMMPGMDAGLMQGMFWGSIVLMAIPLLVGIGIGLFALHRYRTQRPFPAWHRGRD
jgi:hypothetical protein